MSREAVPSVGPAQPEEWSAAFALVFQHCPPPERERRETNALEMVRRGEFNPAGVIVARRSDGVEGAILALPTPGAGGLVWPPLVRAGPDKAAIEDRLIRFAARWLRSQGAKLGQALLLPEEVTLGVPLARNGFRHITQLWYLRHDLSILPDVAEKDSLVFQTYRPTYQAMFHQTLLRTYEGTADCPEVNGVRTIAEIIAGHQAQANYHPDRWWLVRSASEPVGVLLLSEVITTGAWDVSYVGIVPESRRQGFGRQLMGQALREAKAGGAAQLTLSVDGRNRPAWSLYQSLGFTSYEQREVFLAIWQSESSA